MKSANDHLYPAFIKLTGVKCLVVGGGAVALRKVKGLFGAGASIAIVSPELTPALGQLVAENNVMYIKRPYSYGDTQGYQMVFAATSNREVNHAVQLEASERGQLCNVADAPDEGNFYTPSLIRRGMLQVAISTSGASPSLTRELRLFFEDLFGEDVAVQMEELKTARDKAIQEAHGNEELKKQLIEAYVDPLVEKMINRLRK